MKVITTTINVALFEKGDTVITPRGTGYIKADQKIGDTEIIVVFDEPLDTNHRQHEFELVYVSLLRGAKYGNDSNSIIEAMEGDALFTSINKSYWNEDYLKMTEVIYDNRVHFKISSAEVDVFVFAKRYTELINLIKTRLNYKNS